MKTSRIINKKNQMELLMFCLFVWLSVTPCFAQSPGTPTGQQTQQAPSPTINSAPSSIRVDAGGALNRSIYTKKFSGFTLALPQGGRAQEGAARQPSEEPDTETIVQRTDKQSDSQTSEAQATFTYGAEIDFNSGYAWRGLLLDWGPVAQPSAWISAYGFTFTAWGNMAMSRASGDAGLKAVDFLLTYDREWEKLRIEAGLDAYLGRQSSNIEPQNPQSSSIGPQNPQSSNIGPRNPQSSNIGPQNPQSSNIGPRNPQLLIIESRNTMEGSLKLSYPAGPLRIFTIQAFDVLAYRGSYFGEAGVEYERQLSKNTEFMTSIRSGWASAKFNDVYIGVNKSAFNFVGAEGSLTYYRGKHLYFRPHIEFSSITDRRLRLQLSPVSIVNFGFAFGLSK
jgi:hypothetical protein